MYKNFKPLKIHSVDDNITYFRPRQELPEQVSDNNPAVDVMTDLRQVTVYTAELTTPLDKALEYMVKRSVRLLLVRDPDGQVKGLITARDIQGEKPLRIMEKSGASREELLVRDIMTLKGKLEVLMMEDVLGAKVGDIISTLKESGRQHAMVADVDPQSNRLAVRGLFSLAQIAKQMGLNIDASQRATTFAELEEAIRELD